MTNEDAILDVLVPCYSEGEQLAYPMNRIEQNIMDPCLDNSSCFPSLLLSAAGPKTNLSFDLFYSFILHYISFFKLLLAGKAERGRARNRVFRTDRQHHKATLLLLFVGPEKDRFRLWGRIKSNFGAWTLLTY